MDLQALWPVFLLALAVFGIAVAMMAIGVMFKRPCLRGSCGGPALHTAGGKKISCASCPSRNHHDERKAIESGN